MEGAGDRTPEAELVRGRRALPGTGRDGAIVIGGTYLALGIVRSLGRRGIPVWVLSDYSPASASRYTRRSLPWPETDAAAQIAYLLELGERHGLDGWTLFPTSDKDAALLAQHHEALCARFRLTTSPWETLRWFNDKRLTYELAAAQGVPLPRTAYPRDRAEVAALELTFPAILKPAYKAGTNAFVAAKAWRVEDREALLARYDEACAHVPPEAIMVQELLPGGVATQHAYAALCLDGRPIASAMTGHNRQWPVDFGRGSTYAETIEQPEIAALSRRLLAASGYTGPIQFQFKHDPRDGQFKLLDANARMWGSHTVCGRAGVDFPYLIWRLLRGESVPEVRARAGVHWVRMASDIPAALLELRHRRLSVPGYLRSLAPPLELGVFAGDDPLPVVVDPVLKISRFIVGGGGHGRARRSFGPLARQP